MSDFAPVANLWQGARARLWSYSPTLSKISLLLHSEKLGDLEVVCVGVVSITCPVHLASAHLEVVSDWDETAHTQVNVLRDRDGTLEIRCSMVLCQAPT